MLCSRLGCDVVIDEWKKFYVTGKIRINENVPSNVFTMLYLHISRDASSCGWRCDAVGWSVMGFDADEQGVFGNSGGGGRWEA